MIRSWNELKTPEREEVLPQIREIFFTSSTRQSFPNLQAKEAFWSQWTHYYFDFEPKLILLDFHGDRLAGYLMGASDSEKALAEILSFNPSYELFQDLFEKYPAHLHINFHSDFRGRGRGGFLIEDFLQRLQSLEVPGAHLVTVPDTRNAGFYRQHGFEFEETRQWLDRDLLFMGRRLDP